MCSSPFRALGFTVGCVGIAHLRFTCFHCRAIPSGHTFALHGLIVQPFPFLVLWLLLTSHGSLLLRISPSMRPHGISHRSFLVYLPDLRTRVTVIFWALLSMANLPALYASYPISVRQATISLSLPLAQVSQLEPWESLLDSSMTTLLRTYTVDLWHARHTIKKEGELDATLSSRVFNVFYIALHK